MLNIRLISISDCVEWCGAEGVVLGWCPCPCKDDLTKLTYSPIVVTVVISLVRGGVFGSLIVDLTWSVLPVRGNPVILTYET